MRKVVNKGENDKYHMLFHLYEGERTSSKTKNEIPKEPEPLRF